MTVHFGADGKQAQHNHGDAEGTVFGNPEQDALHDKSWLEPYVEQETDGDCGNDDDAVQNVTVGAAAEAAATGAAAAAAPAVAAAVIAVFCY